MLDNRPTVRVLGPPDRDAFVALAGRSPVINVFADYRARLTNLDERWLGGQMWGRFRDGELVAGMHMGANVVPVECTPEDLHAFAPALLRRIRHTGTIVGPQATVRALWDEVGPAWAEPREARWNQPHLELTGPPTVEPDLEVRMTTKADFEALYPACVAMYTEEVGVSPEEGHSADLYRARVQQLIGRGWSFASFDGAGRVVFKAEVACATELAAQIQGVYVRPDRRGEGLAARGMATVARYVRRNIAPVVSLYVNEWNEPARAAYARVGFEQTATMSTLMF